jgi:hypothetical protein
MPWTVFSLDSDEWLTTEMYSRVIIESRMRMGYERHAMPLDEESGGASILVRPRRSIDGGVSLPQAKP